MTISLKKYWLDIVGWTGALFSLMAYSLNSLQYIESASKQYLMMNIIGCFLLIIYTFRKKAYANSVLNSIWLLMTVFAMVRYFVA
jgi:hypothetical protein